jgi:hypothetical protein
MPVSTCRAESYDRQERHDQCVNHGRCGEVPMGRVTVRRPVLRVEANGSRNRPDTLAAEEPLEIRLNSRPLTVTMRTPGNDVELAHGFLLTEGVLDTPEDVQTAPGRTGVIPTTSWKFGWRRGSQRRTPRSNETSTPRLRAAYAVKPRSTRYGCARTTLRPRTRSASVRARSPNCPTGCVGRSGSSTPPAGCMPQACSTQTVNCWSAGRTSGGTMLWTRCSAGRCYRAESRCPGAY